MATSSKKIQLSYPNITVSEPIFVKGDKTSMFSRNDKYEIRIGNSSLEFPTKKEADAIYNETKNFKNEKQSLEFFQSYLLRRLPQRAFITNTFKETWENFSEPKLGQYLTIENFYKVKRGTYFKFEHENFGKKRMTEFVFDSTINDRVLGWMKIGDNWDYTDGLYNYENKICAFSGAEILTVKEMIAPPNKFELPNLNEAPKLSKKTEDDLYKLWDFVKNRKKKSDKLLEMEQQYEEIKPFLSKLTIDNVPTKIQALVLIDAKANRTKKVVSKEQVEKTIQNIWNDYYSGKDTFAYGGAMAKSYEYGGDFESPRIYIVNLEAYNNNIDEGVWLDFSDYKNADELMNDIQNWLDEWGVEEYQIIDGEYLPAPMGMDVSYLTKANFQEIYTLMDVAKEKGISIDDAYEEMYGENDSFAKGGAVNWQKYPTKKVRGLYDIKGDGINRKVNIVFFERYDDELYSLYPLDKDKHLFKEIMVKSTALNSLDKGVSVQGETNDGKKVSIKRISNQDFSYAKGGKVNGEDLYHIEVSKWIKENMPKKYHKTSLDEIPLTAFTKTQLKKRNEFLDIFDSGDFENNKDEVKFVSTPIKEGDVFLDRPNAKSGYYNQRVINKIEGNFVEVQVVDVFNGRVDKKGSPYFETKKYVQDIVDEIAKEKFDDEQQKEKAKNEIIKNCKLDKFKGGELNSSFIVQSELAEELLEFAKYCNDKYSVKDTSTKAGYYGSTQMYSSSKGQAITLSFNNVYRGGYYEGSKPYIVSIQIGGALDINTKVILENVSKYILNKYTFTNDYGISRVLDYGGTNYWSVLLSSPEKDSSYYTISYFNNLPKYAKGGSLDSHGIKQGDTFLKTISGGIQKVKDKDGNIVFINLATGERSSKPPLPFVKGGDVKEEEVTYFVNKDGIRVRSKVEPKEKLSEAEWMAKHSESKEARGYAFGGFFGKSKETVKPSKYPKLEGKQVMLKNGKMVQVFEQFGSTITVVELGKMGSGERPHAIDISEVDMTSFANGGRVGLIGNQSKIDMNHNGKIDAEDFEIMRNTMDGAWRKDRKYVNSTSRKDGKLVDYEVRYARKNNPSRKGYQGKTFAKGGEVYNNSKYLTKEQWEKWNDYVKTGKINGKKVDNMFTVARHIGVPVAKINSYNIEQRAKGNFADGGSLKKIKLKDLVNKRFDIEIGSMSASGDWEDEDEIIKYISDAIKHNLFDSEFYYNWTDDKKEYLEIFKNDTLEPLLKNIDKTLNDLFVFEEKPYPYGNKLKFKMNNDEKENWIDNWFKTNKSISQSLKKDYYNYRDEYAGVKLIKGGAFEKLSDKVAKNYEGNRVKPQYQKEYGKVYSKEEAKEVGDKVAGKVKANKKMATGGETKKGAKGGIMVLAKKIRKDGESWQDALKRAGQQLK